MSNATFVSDVADFIQAVGKFEQRHVAQWFYRGHADCSWQLVPSLYRVPQEGWRENWDDIEAYMMQTFKCEAAPHLAHAPSDDLEWLALAQHYGLPTRLLDWTTNPLIALYFAAEGHPERDADVWCLGFPSTNNCLPESTYLARRLTLRKEDFIYFPRHITPCVTNQSGCFTVHQSEVPLNDPDHLGNRMNWVRMRIAASKKPLVIDQLYNLGVHRGVIYPGLEGIAMRLRFEVTTKNYRHTAVADQCQAR